LPSVGLSPDSYASNLQLPLSSHLTVWLLRHDS
jgi:hypothetical protein